MNWEQATTLLQLDGGAIQCSVFKKGSKEIVTLQHNVEAEGAFVRIHSACITGDIFGSSHCDCGPQLSYALHKVQMEGGVIIYESSHEGRGIGIFDKIRAYEFQRDGMDTLEANVAVGRGVDERDYTDSVDILREIGVQNIKIHTHNPDKVAAVLEGGISIMEQITPKLVIPDEAKNYLKDKEKKFGHEKLI